MIAGLEVTETLGNGLLSFWMHSNHIGKALGTIEVVQVGTEVPNVRRPAIKPKLLV